MRTETGVCVYRVHNVARSLYEVLRRYINVRIEYVSFVGLPVCVHVRVHVRDLLFQSLSEVTV